VVLTDLPDEKLAVFWVHLMRSGEFAANRPAVTAGNAVLTIFSACEGLWRLFGGCRGANSEDSEYFSRFRQASRFLF